MKKIAIYMLEAVLLVTLVALYGCNNPYGTAAKLAQDLAVTVDQSSKTVDSFRIQGTVTADEERSILGWLQSLNTLDGQYIACVQAAHSAGPSVIGGFTACANGLAKGIGDPNTLVAIHVSNPASQQKVTALAQGIVTLVTTTVTALGGK